MFWRICFIVRSSNIRLYGVAAIDVLSAPKLHADQRKDRVCAGDTLLLIGATQAQPRLLATLGVMALSASASAMVLTVGRFLAQDLPRRWLLGVPLGALAGYLGGKVDWLISRIIDLLLPFPVILLAIVNLIRRGSSR